MRSGPRRWSRDVGNGPLLWVRHGGSIHEQCWQQRRQSTPATARSGIPSRVSARRLCGADGAERQTRPGSGLAPLIRYARVRPPAVILKRDRTLGPHRQVSTSNSENVGAGIGDGARTCRRDSHGRSWWRHLRSVRHRHGLSPYEVFITVSDHRVMDYPCGLLAESASGPDPFRILALRPAFCPEMTCGPSGWIVGVRSCASRSEW